MRLRIDEGAIVYEMDSGRRSPFMRRYERSTQVAEQSVREALLWQKKHKQPAKVYLVLDLSDGTISRWDEQDIAGE